MSEQKHRISFLTVSQQYNLNAVCSVIPWTGLGIYHVGSSLTKQDYHDVDLRCILHDDEFNEEFVNVERGEERLKFLNTTISEWIAARTGLPIDFQFQRMTDANKKYKGKRNGVGAL